MHHIEALEKRVDRFMRKLHMHGGDLEMEEVAKSFLSEMERGLTGAASSLRMIPTYVQVDGSIPIDEPVVVLDAGGTNFRVATVRFRSDGLPAVERLAKHEMPGIKKPIGRKEFFNTIVSYMEPNVRDSAKIGFCFSYPTEILPSRDGRLLRFCKEVKAPEVEGEMIGEGLNRALSAAGLGARHVVLLNDTVATLLAGKSLSTTRAYGGWVGFILGTGTNCAYIESNENVRKAPDLDPSARQIINVESGSFGKMPRGKIDVELDGQTTDPGQYTFEKMISGGYFGTLSSRILEAASREGLFSDAHAQALLGLPPLETPAVSAYLRSPRNPAHPLVRTASEDDLAIEWFLIDRLLDRAAKLTAASLSSVVLKSGGGSDPSLPVCITADGTTFWELKGLKQRVDCHLRGFLTAVHKRYFEFVGVENATLIGAAIAGLTN